MNESKESKSSNIKNIYTPRPTDTTISHTREQFIGLTNSSDGSPISAKWVILSKQMLKDSQKDFFRSILDGNRQSMIGGVMIDNMNYGKYMENSRISVVIDILINPSRTNWDYVIDLLGGVELFDILLGLYEILLQVGTKISLDINKKSNEFEKEAFVRQFRLLYSEWESIIKALEKNQSPTVKYEYKEANKYNKIIPISTLFSNFEKFL